MARKILAVALIAVIMVALGIGIWSMQNQPPKYSGPIEEVVIGASGFEVSSLVYIALDQGFYVDNGLNVTIKEFESGRLTAEALLKGEVDISTTADFAFVTLSFDNSNLRVMASISVTNDDELIARKDHGIEQPSDLKGKRVGVSRGTAGEFFLGRFLTQNSLSMNDIDIVNLNPVGLIDAISNGTIDAMVTWQPYVYYAKQRLGTNALAWSAQGGQGYYWLLLSRQDWVKANPSSIERVLKAMVQAEQFVKTNGETSKQIISRHLKHEFSYVESIWRNYDFDVTLPQVLLLVMEDQARWRIQNNLTTKTEVPNFLDFIYFDGLEAVKPQAVTIIH